MSQVRLSSSIFFLSLALLLSLAPFKYSYASDKESASIKQGRQIVFDRKKGNCLACHDIAGGESPGTIGPRLVSMKARFSDREKLRQQINDARSNNPHTIMPPFGKFRILTDQEIEQVIDFLYTL